MGVKKFRSVDQMEGPPPLIPLDPDNFARVFEVIALAEQFCECHYEPGIRKFRSAEHAHKFREQREAEWNKRRRKAR